MKISLCMIVRDEARNLAQCLGTVANYVDEIVVVDTGSTDETKQVAESFGAVVVDHNVTTHPESFFLDDEATCSKFGAPPPYSGFVALGDFSAPRNHSFSLATGDFVLWLDSDDVLENGGNLRSVVEDMNARGLDMAMLAYDYARDHLERVHYKQWRERIVRRGTHAWINPIHEVLLPNNPNLAHARYDSLLVVHRRKNDRAMIPNRNYKNLLRQYAATLAAGATPDPRTLFYLGQESRYVVGHAEKAVAFYEEYLHKSGWSIERAAAHLALGQLYEYGNISMPVEVSRQHAYDHFAVAAAEEPDSPDGLFGMARIAYLRNMWADCVVLTHRALAIGNTESLLGANPTARAYQPHVYLNYALFQLGRLPEAIESCRAALAACPDDPGIPGAPPGMIKSNLAFFERQLAERQQMQKTPTDKPGVWMDKNEDVDAPAKVVPPDVYVIWAMQIWKQLCVEGDASKVRAFLGALPRTVLLDPVHAKMRASTERRFGANKQIQSGGTTGFTGPTPDMAKYGSFRAKKKDDVLEVKRTVVMPGAINSIKVDVRLDRKKFVLWVGQNIENWGPDAPDTTGIGGSETAAIAVCRGLAARGWDVTVYGCPPREETRDGVRWLRHEKFDGVGPDVDVFVSSRDPSVMQARVEAKVKLLWLHDINCGPPHAELERWLLRFDRVLCLSQWHKQHLLEMTPTLHESRVVVTRNGIDLERYAAFSLAPRANKMIWSSSPPRGLDMLLSNMPYIRSGVPDAELHVYYGFETWEAFARLRPQTGELQEIERYKQALRSTEGVVWHGRVNQKQLAEAQLSAKVWPYITEFTETSCITAMECQAAGAVPVTTRLAALAETVKVGKLIDPGPMYGQEFVDEVVRLLTDEPYWNTQAEWAHSEAVRNFSWATLVDEWIGMFAELENDVVKNPVHPWRRAQ